MSCNVTTLTSCKLRICRKKYLPIALWITYFQQHSLALYGLWMCLICESLDWVQWGSTILRWRRLIKKYLYRPIWLPSVILTVVNIYAYILINHYNFRLCVLHKSVWIGIDNKRNERSLLRTCFLYYTRSDDALILNTTLVYFTSQKG